MARVELSSITKRFPGRATPVVEDVSLAIGDGEFVVLLGPSGCGKSTLLRMIAGLDDPDEGAIAIDGIDVTDKEPKERDIALVFQQYALYPHLTVEENLRYPLKVVDLSRAERQERVRWAAELVGLDGLLDRLPSQLSGGEQQRVAVARAIVRRPRLFLMDEPLSNLDAQTRLRLRAELRGLQRELGTTTIMVTHDQADAMALADRIVLLADGQIQQDDSPDEVYDAPANRFVADFMGSPAMNLILATAAGGMVELGPEWRVPAPAADGPVVVGLRPEALAVLPGPEPGAGVARVTLVEPLGSEVIVHANVGGTALRVRTGPRVRPAVGQTIHLRADVDRLRLFDPVSGKAYPVA
jgi:ABC-type sugar transport system ATPase subunit